MKARTLFLMSTAGMSIGISAGAQDACASYVGQTVTPVTINAAIKPYSKLTPKGEFETTAAFVARRAAAVQPLARTLVIAKDPDRKFLQYDADARRLRVAAWAFENLPFNFRSAIRSASPNEDLGTATSNVQVVIRSVDTPKGTHAATNSYGATTQVREIHRVTTDIFDRTPTTEVSVFVGGNNPEAILGELEFSPEEAALLKPTLKLAFVATPVEPFLYVGTHQPFEATIQDPRQITEDFSILVADLQCGLVTDAANKVLAAYPTR